MTDGWQASISMGRTSRGWTAIAVAVLVLVACSGPHTNHNGEDATAAIQKYATTTTEVLDAVKAAQRLSHLPDSVAASLAEPNEAGPDSDGGREFDCRNTTGSENPAHADQFGSCAFGDPLGSKLMVIYGDSLAVMWAAALQVLAEKHGWKLKVFSLGGCPGPDLHFLSAETKRPNTDCDTFHTSAPATITALHPDLVIVTSVGGHALSDGNEPTHAQWQDGWVSILEKLSQPGTRLAMIGSIPVWENNGARCLAAHLRAVQECSAPVAEGEPTHLDAEQAAAAAGGALYVPVIPWVCAERCEPVIADMVVYSNPYHLTEKYAVYLTGALEEAMMPALM